MVDIGSLLFPALCSEEHDPVIGWNLAAASTALFGLILAVNLVGDAIRDILDPKTLWENR